jgi:hypothetical protein
MALRVLPLDAIQTGACGMNAIKIDLRSVSPLVSRLLKRGHAFALGEQSSFGRQRHVGRGFCQFRDIGQFGDPENIPPNDFEPRGGLAGKEIAAQIAAIGGELGQLGTRRNMAAARMFKASAPLAPSLPPRPASSSKS